METYLQGWVYNIADGHPSKVNYITEVASNHSEENMESEIPDNLTEVQRWEYLVRMIIADNRRREEETKTRDRILHELPQQLNQFGIQVPTAAAAVQVVPDVLQNIPDFDGETDLISAKDWINLINNKRIINNWQDNHALEVARLHLVRGAKRWFEMKVSELTTWPAFQAAFKKTFIIYETLTTKWDRMRKRVQRENEGTLTYVLDKIKLCNDLDLTMNEIKSEVLKGLWSHIPMTLLNSTIDDTDSLLHEILRVEREYKDREELVKWTKTSETTEEPRSRKVSKEGILSGFTKMSENNARITRETVMNDKKFNDLPRQAPSPKPPEKNASEEFICYNCSKTGHLARNCPEPLKCKEGPTTSAVHSFYKTPLYKPSFAPITESVPLPKM